MARTPAAMLKLPLKKLEQVIYPVGFYRTKAKAIHQICRRLIDEYGGVVPDSIDELVTLPGVGRKTANLVVTISTASPGSVDIHVHRISNRWGYINEDTGRVNRLRHATSSTGSSTTISSYPMGRIVLPVSPAVHCKLELCDRVGVKSRNRRYINRYAEIRYE